MNIAVNARDAMPEGGTLTLSARNIHLPAGEASASAGDFVALSLHDTGNGIAPEVLPKVFEPFFTTKPTDKGTGLGLSQVYGFAQASGGSVKAESRPGEGTTITLYLPRSHAQPVATPEPEGPPRRNEASVTVRPAPAGLPPITEKEKSMKNLPAPEN